MPHCLLQYIKKKKNSVILVHQEFFCWLQVVWTWVINRTVWLFTLLAPLFGCIWSNTTPLWSVMTLTVTNLTGFMVLTPSYIFLQSDKMTCFSLTSVSLVPTSMILGRGGNCRVNADRAGSSAGSDWDEETPPDSPHVCRTALLWANESVWKGVTQCQKGETNPGTKGVCSRL